jgi:hypothetical protein
MPSISRTVLLQHESVRIVPLVLFGVVVALSALAALQSDEHAICFLGHSGVSILCIRWNSEAGAQGEDRTHDLTLTKGVLYH